MFLTLSAKQWSAQTKSHEKARCSRSIWMWSMSEEMGSAQRNSGGSWHQPETASWFFKGNIPVETKKGEKPIWWALKAAKAVANI